MHILRIITVITLATLISACSFSKKEEPNLYQSNVKSAHPLVMPANLSKEDQEDFYPMPQLESQPPNTKVTILPPGSPLANNSKK